MEKKYLAKSNPIQTIEEHTNNLLKSMNKFMNLYGDKFTIEEKELIAIACKFHDYGKINELFQKKIKTHEYIPEEISHGFLSGMLMDYKYMNEKYGKDTIEALYTAIHYHHKRNDEYTDLQYEQYIKKYFLDNAKEYFKNPDLKVNQLWLRRRIFKYPNNNVLNKEISLKKWEKYILIKGMLNKFDYAASEGILEIEEKTSYNGKNVSTAILEKFNNKLLPAQEFMYKNKNENLIVIAPTGSGKTEAALLWLDKDKGFYTLPLKVASNNIYLRIKDKYNYPKIGLLHSGALSLYILEENGFEKYESIKKLHKPLTICTVDQLFKFPFKALGTEIYPATLKYSKVIIDEIQMYSPTILACLIIGLKIISDMGGKFAIMTATLPPILRELIDENIGAQNYKFEKFVQAKNSNRHMFKIINSDFNINNILSSNSNKILVICNTVAKAQEIYEKLLSKGSNIEIKLLHSNFIKKHRDKLEKSIMEDSRISKKCIWVSTQIVEASLDIDFDELHTEMCLADSLLQRFGRCYRSRTYTSNNPNIYIYNTKNGVGFIYDEDIYNLSIEKISSYENKIFREEDKMVYIEEVYSRENIKETKYYKNLVASIDKVKNIFPMEFEQNSVDKVFRSIQNINVIPEKIYTENYELINKLIDIITNANISNIDKYRAKMELNEYVMSVNKFGKYKKFIDNTPLVQDIYRCNSNYLYENKKMGLIAEENIDEEFI